MKKTKKKTKKIKPSSKKKKATSSKSKKSKTKKKTATKKPVKKKAAPKKKVVAKKAAKKKTVAKKKPVVKAPVKQAAKPALKVSAPPPPSPVRAPEPVMSLMEEKIIPPIVEEGEEPIEDMTTMEDGYSGFDDSVSSEPDDEEEN